MSEFEGPVCNCQRALDVFNSVRVAHEPQVPRMEEYASLQHLAVEARFNALIELRISAMNLRISALSTPSLSSARL